MKTQYIAATIFILAMALFYWRSFFMKKKLRYPVFSNSWRPILKEKVQFYNRLTDDEKKRFEQNILQFLNDITITGVEITLDDTDRLLVASSAVIPLFGFPNWQYRNLNEVLLYQGTFDQDYDTQGKERNILGMVGTGAMNRMMILSQPALHQGFEQNGKSNVGIHEFVHLLDKADGETDGIPEVLLSQQYVIPWLTQMHKEIKQIHAQQSDINPYGATKESEFLSVVSEYFFNQPELLNQNHPELFALLEKIYRQDLD